MTTVPDDAESVNIPRADFHDSEPPRGCRECTICGRTLHISQFNPRRRSSRAKYGDECHDCLDAKLNRVRPCQPWTIWERDGFTCILCGKCTLRDVVRLEVVLIESSRFIMGNMVTVCTECANQMRQGDLADYLTAPVIDSIFQTVSERNEKSGYANDRFVVIGLLEKTIYPPIVVDNFPND